MVTVATVGGIGIPLVFPCRGHPERRMKLFGDAESVIRHRYWLAEGIATAGC
jgi:hypothetical protein